VEHDLIDSYIGPLEAARRLGVTRAMVTYLFDRGLVTGRRTAIGRLIDPTSVEQYRLARNERKTARIADQALRAVETR
jgi:hypothetical protein